LFFIASQSWMTVRACHGRNHGTRSWVAHIGPDWLVILPTAFGSCNQEDAVKRIVIVTVILPAILLLASCGSSAKHSSSGATTTLPTVSPYATTTTSASNETTTTAASASSVVLKLAMNAKLHRNIIVDAAGRTVYLFVPNGVGLTNKVPAAIASAWPQATTAAASPTVGPGLTASELHVTMQSNGAHQIVYNSRLLYTFSGDAGPGTANGQGLAKIWYVLSAAGTPIK
jgi:predicted lipoprotein with Yx(FWY)xxD motif